MVWTHNLAAAEPAALTDVSARRQRRPQSTLTVLASGAFRAGRSVCLDFGKAARRSEKIPFWARTSSPLKRDTTAIPSTGKPTAVIKKPISAGRLCVPAFCPRKGGKIRLPAPKNIENNVRLSRIRFFLEHFFIKLSFLFDPRKNRPTKDGLTAVPPWFRKIPALFPSVNGLCL